MIAVLFGIIVWQQRREIQRLRHSNAYLRETLAGHPDTSAEGHRMTLPTLPQIITFTVFMLGVILFMKWRDR